MLQPYFATLFSLRQNYTQNLISSMRRRLELILAKDGYWIPY